MGDLKSKSINTVRWNLIAKFSQYFITFFLSIILARYISPAEFGLTGMLSIFISVSNVLLNAGLSSALIRDKSASEDDYSTVFYFNIVVSFSLYGILFVCAPLIAGFYKEPELIPLTRLITLVFVISSFGLIQNTQLVKELNFRKQTIINLLALLISIIVGIVLAVTNYGVYAIVWQTLIQALIVTVLLWATSTWRPSGTFKKKSFLKLWKFASNVLFTGIFNAVANNLDNLMIGKVFNKTTLGFFVRAKSTNAIPENIFTSVIGTAAFSILSKLNDNLDEFRLKQFTFFKLIFTFALPLSIIFHLLSRDLVIVLYGQKWEASIPLLQILSFSLLPMLLSTLTGQVLMSLGDSRNFLYLSVIKRSLNFALIPIGIFLGLYAFVISYAVAQYIGFFIDLTFVSRKINMPIKSYLIYSIKPILISLFVLGLGSFRGNIFEFGHLLNIVFHGLIYVLLFMLAYRLILSEELNNFLSVLPFKRKK